MRPGLRAGPGQAARALHSHWNRDALPAYLGIGFTARRLRRINHHQQWSPLPCTRSVVAAMPIHSFIPGVFGPEAIAAMGEAFEREVIAGRIIAAARFGERNPVRLREAALRKPD